MLGGDSMTYCKNEASTTDIKGVFNLTFNTTVDPDAVPDDKTKVDFCFAVKGAKQTLYVGAESDADKASWIQQIRDNIKLLPEVSTEEEQVDLAGYLTKRAVVSGDNWKARWFVLKGPALQYFKDENSPQSKGEFVLTPDSTVYDTNLRPFAFEVVTPSKVAQCTRVCTWRCAACVCCCVCQRSAAQHLIARTFLPLVLPTPAHPSGLTHDDALPFLSFASLPLAPPAHTHTHTHTHTHPQVLHIFAADEAEKAKWIELIKKNIRESTAHVEMDPVQEAARRRAALDDFYDVV
jgi:hypothetical protein